MSSNQPRSRILLQFPTSTTKLFSVCSQNRFVVQSILYFVECSLVPFSCTLFWVSHIYGLCALGDSSCICFVPHHFVIYLFTCYGFVVGFHRTNLGTVWLATLCLLIRCVCGSKCQQLIELFVIICFCYLPVLCVTSLSGSFIDFALLILAMSWLPLLLVFMF